MQAFRIKCVVAFWCQLIGAAIKELRYLFPSLGSSIKGNLIAGLRQNKLKSFATSKIEKQQRTSLNFSMKLT